MNTLVIIAEKEELELARQLFPQFEVRITGVGAANIYRSLGNLDRDTHLINIGYAGSANFEVGTGVRVTEAFLHHPHVSYPEPAMKLPAINSQLSIFSSLQSFVAAPCYTSVDFVLESPYKDCVFDMELAFIIAMGFGNVEAYKYVSDNLSLHEYRKNANN